MNWHYPSEPMRFDDQRWMRMAATSVMELEAK